MRSDWLLRITLVTVVAMLPGDCWANSVGKSIRMTDGHNNQFGGIKGIIQFFYNGTWNYINGSDWDYADARVACKEFGYNGVARLYRNSTTFTIPKRMRRFNPWKLIPTIVEGVKCIGEERAVEDCIIEGAKNLFLDEPMPGSNYTVDDVAGVSCTDMKTTRLTGGASPHEGRAEVFFDNKWGTVCDDDWGMEDANVLCKELGYPGALSALGSAAFGKGSPDEKIWMDDTECSGNESSLLLCQKKRKWGDHNCIHDEDASAICATNSSIKSCPILPKIAHGNASTECADIGTEVFFTCIKGFVIQGNKEIKCLPTGKWSGNIPYCFSPRVWKPTSCPPLPEISNARPFLESTTIGTIVQFECNEGFMLFGHNKITCTDRGMWNGIPPACLVEYMNSCPELPVPANAKATHYDKGNVLETTYRCNAGYTMIGFEKISCVRYGHMAQWNGPPPMCFHTSSPISMQSDPNQVTSSDQNIQVKYQKNISVGAAVGISIGVVFAVILATIVLGTVYWHVANRQKREHRPLNNLSSPLLEADDNGK